MGVRSRLIKILGGAPAAMQAGEAVSQMTPATPFSPGAPIHPHDGFQRTPRSHDFVTGYNIAARPRSHERVSFDTLKGLVEAYDVASMCVWHRIDSIRSLDWSLVAADGYGDDVSDAIKVGMAALKKPDRDTPFATWLAEWLYDILAYDAGTLYRMRNRAGRAIGLRPVDGTSIAPLLDYWGNTPADPAEAFVQYAQGLPWNWLTRKDLIYTPFRKVTGSPYGRAPLESILLNANTDLRFQAHFLQHFTEGNIPAAFASAPESWTPQQIEAFQGYWDAFMLGDQAVKSQIKWLPAGGKIQFTSEQDFSDQFSLFLMRKTAAAYHVVPADLGFTENVNRSSGESQADVQHRVGDLPLIKHVDGVLTSFLQDDLGLPLRFSFDLGEEQTDRYQQAQADKIYVDLGAISPSDVREMRYGLPEPDGIPVPRFVFTDRGGPIPLASLYAVAGKVDPSTAAPEPGAPLPHEVFGGTEGVTPSPPIKTMPLAEQIYGPSAMPVAPPPQPAAPVQKEPAAAGGSPTVGVTAETGITAYDLIGQDDDEETAAREELAKRELAAFRRFKQARRRKGEWHDFDFRAVDRLRAHRLNDAGRLAFRKTTGEVAVAGLAVRAADTGRVLMLQRALDEEDPAAGTWEFPGGHCEEGETPLQACWREWAEETARIPPPGQQTGSWTSPDGVYQGIVWTVDSEACVPVNGDGDGIVNPDDPDGDVTEAIAWWDPAQLAGNPAVRPELLDSLDLVMAALGMPQGGDEDTCPCGTPVVFDELDGWQHADGSISHDDGESVSDKMGRVVKSRPKGGKASAVHWPGWDTDEALAAQFSATLNTGLHQALGPTRSKSIASGWVGEQGGDPLGWLQSTHPNLFTDARDTIAAVLGDLWREGWALGESSARTLLERATVTKAGNGSSSATPVVVDEDTLRDWLDTYGVGTIQGITDTRMADLAAALDDAVEEGWPVGRLASEIEGFAASTADTDLIAVTELARAVSQGALAAYDAAGVSEVAWLTAPGACKLCQDNADAGPVPPDSNFPSGVPAPPGHPRCRCSLQPAAISGIDILNVLAGGEA